MSTDKRRWYYILATGSLVALCATAISSLQLPKLNQLKSVQAQRTESEFQREVAQEGIALKLLKAIPNFGFDNLIADWAYVKFLIYFGDEPAREHTGYDLTPQYFEIALNEDPRFIPAYFGLSSSISLYLGEPKISTAMMEKGLQLLSPQDPPRSYYIWRYLGIDQLLFLGDAQAAQASFAKAAEWASEYSDLESENVVALSHSTAGFLAQNPDSKQAQFAAWMLVYRNAVDEQTRDRAIQGIKSVGGIVQITENGDMIIQPPPND
ncbi:MAG: hypothetical protein J7545_17890 [Roseofilum sp. SBFL]|uniref:hypothetical protein n=1 Tax=unclassified Roseofilum TaxID=2620099 RepID=UPI001B1AFF74|nr:MULTISPECIES: hypothetical protein [unclassified Roseofilum]MBP0015852.1 hypothetical protein [Roseofilum sp. SID3]MBP0025412.1 hypothetical protein [Roseofilum sp. SID2]MBP0029000.1 hypothetical protein [Roseofilum sp. Guam]MBP0038672.1 hypothetical protein [Roseofilum sp. SID1]MBP0043820.1 hypothetical protein [Roseofilum sp. SBFL]